MSLSQLSLLVAPAADAVQTKTADAIRLGNDPGYLVAGELHRFLTDEVLPLLDLDVDGFWAGFARVFAEFGPRNERLLGIRDDFQRQLDQWHAVDNADASQYLNFLTSIGYIAAEGEPFEIDTENVDAEISSTAGPQLVVPLQNARFAINAVNARWGSFYDALYGSNVIDPTGDLAPGQGYNPKRGKAVIEYAKQFLDDVFPLTVGSHQQAVSYHLYYRHLVVHLANGKIAGLQQPKQFVGVNGPKTDPQTVLLANNGLHVALHFDRAGSIGANDQAGLQDIELEAAATAIMDCEDSVAVVDTADKVDLYRNWLALTTGSARTEFAKGGRTIARTLNRDRVFTGRDNQPLTLPGRSLMLIRNTALHAMNDAVTDLDGREMPEGILDAIVTSLIASLDIAGSTTTHNSKSGSIYIVKPKLHGPDEVAFTCDLFAAVEILLNLAPNTIKIGIMDEERRTSVNLAECIRVARHRVIFINTGFLDRTGDEVHSGMEAGPFLPKAELKQQIWMDAYEQRNVDIGLSCGMRGRGQIGKGMWPKPDEMEQMLQTKIGHPRSGASTAWVPSPTAAVLHATHYHVVSVAEEQQLIARSTAPLEDLLTIPLIPGQRSLTSADIRRELEDNVQSILGYVVRWVHHGVGCSKILDIDNVGLMEDRATLRISSQLLANWLHHDLCTPSELDEVLLRMSAVVDEQNRFDPTYRPLVHDGIPSLAFKAARELIIQGREQPNGYTELVLQSYRRQAKEHSEVGL